MKFNGNLDWKFNLKVKNNFDGKRGNKEKGHEAQQGKKGDKNES